MTSLSRNAGSLLFLYLVREAGLTIHPDKCFMGMAKVQYLEHRVGGGPSGWSRHKWRPLSSGPDSPTESKYERSWES